LYPHSSVVSIPVLRNLTKGGRFLINLGGILSNSTISVKETMYYLKGLYYGPSGVGKTVLAGTTPNLFIVSAEKGLLSLKNPDLKNIVNQDARVFYLSNFIEMNMIYEFLYNHCRLRDILVNMLNNKEMANDEKFLLRIEKVKDSLWSLEHDVSLEPRLGREPQLYYAVVIDSLTELQKRSMDRILDIKHQMVANNQPITPVENDSIDILEDFSSFEVPAATLPDYGTNTNQMRKLIRAFRDLPMHVIFTALAREEKDDISGEIITRPALTDKLAEDVFGYVNVVGYYYTRLVKSEDGKDNIIERILQVQPFKNRVAKDGSGRLGNGIKNPTFTKIMELITGENKVIPTN
jgi:hypothetical protein